MQYWSDNVKFVEDYLYTIFKIHAAQHVLNWIGMEGSREKGGKKG